jgi:hypothetical protein
VILFLINALDSRVLSWGNAVCLAAFSVPHYIAGFVLGGPLAIRTGNFRFAYDALSRRARRCIESRGHRGSA